MKNTIRNVLLQIGIPASIDGFEYLTEAVTLGIKNPQAVHRMTKNLYPEVAKAVGSSPSKVERSIRHAINISWSKDRIICLNQIFKLNIFKQGDKPSNHELIGLLVEKIPQLA